MELAAEKCALPQFLARQMLRLSALVLQKLVLAGQQDDEQVKIRHYDLQCEAIEILVGFFKNKQQGALLKAFTSIRNTPSSPKVSVPATQKPNGTTRRTYLNTTFTASEYSPIRDVHFHTVRSQKEDLDKDSLSGSQAARNVDLQKLLSRVKLANSHMNCSYSFREDYNSRQELGHAENSTYYMPQNGYSRMKTSHSRLPERQKLNQTVSAHDYSHYYTNSQGLGKKNSRRQFILQKFSKIESGLVRLGERGGRREKLSGEIMGEIYNIKQRLRL